MCRYGLINTASETRDVLMGSLSIDKSHEKFVPSVYLKKRELFTQIKTSTAKPDDIYDLLSLDINKPSQSTKDHRDEEIDQEGLTKYHLTVLKVGNFLLPILTKPRNLKFEANFQTVKTQIRSILEHCEKVILNQISLVESSAQKKNTSLQAIIFNEVNKSVVYYPFSKFSLSGLPSAILQFAVAKFTACLISGTVSELECHVDGFNLSLSKWNQRTILVYSDDRKLAPKDFNNQLAAFRASLTDIFI
jgi:hypothetical protein